MKLHEFQSKEIFSRYKIPVPNGTAISSADHVESAFNGLESDRAVVKAQVHAGGRGKAGGIKVVSSAEEAMEFAETLLGKNLVTKQSGQEGQLVSHLLIEEPSEIVSEIYVGVVIDRSLGLPTVIVCAEGGVEIEEVAAKNPEMILRESFEPDAGLQPFQSRRIFLKLGLDKSLMLSFGKILDGLTRLFTDCDCSLAEINPLVITKDNELIALDAKLNLDDNGLARHPDLAELRDPTQEEPREVEASKFDLSYIGLDGNIGCMVNGAGLAMATMDIIKLHGGEPANFLDVGGGATAEKVTAAFKIILSDENVKAILVNIFGGIMQCDIIAEGVIAAVRELSLDVPLVVRLEGTNVERGREMLESSGLPLLTAESLEEAAKKVVEAAN